MEETAQTKKSIYCGQPGICSLKARRTRILNLVSAENRTPEAFITVVRPLIRGMVAGRGKVKASD